MNFSATMNSKPSLFKVMIGLIINMKKYFEASLTSAFKVIKMSMLNCVHLHGRKLVSKVMIHGRTFVLEVFFLSWLSLTSQRSNT